MTANGAGDATADMAESVGRLIRQEMRTVGEEMRQKMVKAGTGGALLAVGGALLLYAGGCAVAAFVSLLGRVLPRSLAAAVTAVVLAALGGFAGLLGVDQVRRALPLVPERAAADVAAVAEGDGEA